MLLLSFKLKFISLFLHFLKFVLNRVGYLLMVLAALSFLFFLALVVKRGRCRCRAGARTQDSFSSLPVLSLSFVLVLFVVLFHEFKELLIYSESDSELLVCRL